MASHYLAACVVGITGSGNGLLPDGTKPLPEPIMTKTHDALLCRQWLWQWWHIHHAMSSWNTPWHTGQTLACLFWAFWRKWTLQLWEWLQFLSAVLITHGCGQSEMGFTLLFYIMQWQRYLVAIFSKMLPVTINGYVPLHLCKLTDTEPCYIKSWKGVIKSL